MLAKKNRVNTKEVDLIFKQGKFFSTPNLTFKYIKVTSKDIKISFVAPKSVAKLAVKRNFLRRKGYNVLKKYIKDFHLNFPLGLIGVFVFKKYQEDNAIIENEIQNILSKITDKNN